MTATGLEAGPRTVTRPRVAADESAVRELHDATRAADLADWPAAAAAEFLDLQYRAREANLPPECADQVIDLSGRIIGRQVIARSATRWQLMIFEVLPQFQGQGVGSAALAALCHRADCEGRDIELHVIPGNPAAQLYHRHGFRFAQHQGLHQLLTRPAMPAPAQGRP